jgi:hypothetical protein
MASDALSATISVPPETSGSMVSSTEMSKESVVKASSFSPAVNPGWRCIEERKLETERCSISTPLGRPVEPEV